MAEDAVNRETNRQAETDKCTDTVCPPKESWFTASTWKNKYWQFMHTFVDKLVPLDDVFKNSFTKTKQRIAMEQFDKLLKKK